PREGLEEDVEALLADEPDHRRRVGTGMRTSRRRRERVGIDAVRDDDEVGCHLRRQRTCARRQRPGTRDHAGGATESGAERAGSRRELAAGFAALQAHHEGSVAGQGRPVRGIRRDGEGEDDLGARGREGTMERDRGPQAPRSRSTCSPGTRRIWSRLRVMGRILIVGLDGATWSLLEPWARMGRMPALAALMDRGAWGTLRSTIPPLTLPAWSSFMTGRNPGAHGVFAFRRLSPGRYETAGLASAADLRAPTLWDIAGRAGKQVGVISVPPSYPLRPVNGFV